MHIEHAGSARRTFLRVVPLCGAGLIAVAASPFVAAQKKQEEEEVSTNEDLMREHGLLKRVLLIYDEIIRRVQAKSDFPPQTITDSANIIRNFIEDYHEKLEEDYLFPRFRKTQHSRARHSEEGSSAIS